jgi:hypothetical protein
MKKKKKIKKNRKFNSTKSKDASTDVPDTSTIHRSHYTPLGEHPEDRIFKDREYIQRLHKHVDFVYDLLASDLRLNDEGYNWLFDYVFNSDDDFEFEEYLASSKIQYCNLVK